jgi:hypothetical protein
MPLSEHVQDLIEKSRMVSFDPWRQVYPAKAIQLWQTADDERRYLTDDDLAQLQELLPDLKVGLDVAKTLRDDVNAIVESARALVLETFPGITEPGRSLYPAERASACWRDFWHFLRCITYGISAHRADYTSAEGLHYMQLLYQELQVPLDAMVVGLEGIKQSSLSRLTITTLPLEPYFDHLILQLRQFR